ncbi:hypothetical protein [Blautia stercoris]
MELINNTTKTLRDDLSVEIKGGSKLSIAAACFFYLCFSRIEKTAIRYNWMIIR